MPRSALAAALPALALVAALVLPPIRVLLKPGDATPDGAALVTVDRPAAAARGQLAVHGTTSALARVTAAGLTVVARSGDPLPPPLVGSFIEFSNPAISNGGAIAFVATSNASNAPMALFVDVDGTRTLVDPGGRTPAVNGRGDVAYREGNAGVTLWRRATAAAETVARRGDAAPGGGVLGRLRVQPALNDAGQVAFVSDFANREVGGVFTWTAATGLQTVARTAAPSGVPGLAYGRFSTEPVALNAAGDVAFVAPLGAPGSAEGAFVWRIATGETQAIAMTGDTIDGERLSAIGPYIGADSAGRVAFAGTFGERTRLVLGEQGGLRPLTGDIAGAGGFFPVLTDSGRVVWVRNGGLEQYDLTRGTIVGSADRSSAEARFIARAPGVNEAGTAVFAGTHEALHLLGPAGTTTLAGTGDALAGTGYVLSFGAHVARGNRVAFFATMRDGGRALVTPQAGGLVRIAAVREESPIGGTLDLADDVVDVEGRSVVFYSGLNAGVTGGVFRAKVGQAGLRVLLQQGNPAPGGGVFQRVERVIAAGDETLVVARLDPGETQSALFAVRRGGRRIVRLAGTGDPAPGTPGSTLLGIGPVVVSGPRALFIAGVSGTPPSAGLFLRKGKRITRIPTVEAVAGGTSPFALAGALALEGKTIAVVGIRPDAAGTLGIFFRRTGPFEAAVIEGEPNPLGAPLDLGVPVLALAGGTVVFQPGLADGTAEPLFGRDVAAR